MNGQFRRNVGKDNGGRKELEDRKPNPPKDTLAVSKGAVAAISSNYRFSKEAVSTLERHFCGLLVKAGDRSRFSIGGEFGYNDHPHALGAFLRAYFHDLVLFKYEPMYVDGDDDHMPQVLDIGSSPVRMYSRYQNGVCEATRNWMMCPNLGIRDEMRDAGNSRRIQRLISDCVSKGLKAPEISTRVCHCVGAGGEVIDERKKCEICSRGVARVVTSVDSFYYPGVLEEMFEQLAEGSNIGYVVGNDYHHAMIKLKEGSKNPFEGSACVNSEGVPESTFKISLGHKPTDANEGWLPDIRVTSTVRGNPLPYEHGILKTHGKENFAYTYKCADGISRMFVFEQLQCVWNGDVPYKIWRIYKTALDKAADSEKEYLGLMDNWWLNVGDIVEEQKKLVELQVTKALEREKEDLKLVTALESIETKVDEKEVFQAPDLFDVSSYDQKLSQHRDWVLNLVERKQRVEGEVAFFRWVRLQFDRTDHQVRIRYIANEAWMYVTVTNSDGWFGLRSQKKSLTVRAKLSAVLEAYVKIGIKSQATSIFFTMVTNQRECKQTTDLFNMSEAYTIARLIRSYEEKRFSAILTPTH